jgi:hypothetical protein
MRPVHSGTSPSLRASARLRIFVTDESWNLKNETLYKEENVDWYIIHSKFLFFKFDILDYIHILV